MQLPRVRPRPWKPSGNSPWREPRPFAWFPAFVDLIGGAYVRWGLGLDRVVIRRTPALVEALKGTRTRGDRLVLVFRHCGDADPQGLWYALNTVAKADYRRLKPGPRPRFLFLSSAEIALWGGPVADLALRASGTLPLAHGIGSRPSLDYLRRHFRESSDPVVLAPEGQITYELLGPIVLDPGAANMALWAAEAAPGEARVMPLGLRYRCPRETWPRWNRFMNTLERGLGLGPWPQDGIEASSGLRLGRIWDHLLEVGESYYRKNHRRVLPPLPSREERCRRLFRVSIELAASVRGITVGTDYRAALFQLRSSAMDLVFPRNRDSSRLGALMETRGATEGWWINRHQDLADVLQGLNPDLPNQPSLERAIEAALNLADLAGRLAGGHIDERPRYFRRVLEITVGESWVVDRSPGQSHRTRAAEVTARIQQAFEALARDES